MHTSNTIHQRLDDLPLWRLLVALDDAERVVGADATMTRMLVRVVRERLRINNGDFLAAPGKRAPSRKRCRRGGNAD